MIAPTFCVEFDRWLTYRADLLRAAAVASLEIAMVSGPQRRSLDLQIQQARLILQGKAHRP